MTGAPTWRPYNGVGKKSCRIATALFFHNSLFVGAVLKGGPLIYACAIYKLQTLYYKL